MRCLIAALVLSLGLIDSAMAGETSYAQQAIAVPLVIHHDGHQPRVQLLVTPLAAPVVVVFFADVPRKSFTAIRVRRLDRGLSRCQ